MNRLLLQHVGCIALFLAFAHSGDAERCVEEMDVGNCSEQIQRWYFNQQTGLCQPFTYTGCGGNGNNFNSTEYCHHACHRANGHSYSIEDAAEKLKGKQVAGVGATTPTDFSKQQQHLYSTRQPTLIRNQPDSDTKQQQLDRRPVDQTNEENRPRRRRREVREGRRRRKTNIDQDVGYDVAPEEKFAGEPARWRNLKARRYGTRQLQAADQYVDDYSYYNDDGGWNDGVGGNSFRRRGRGRGGGVSAMDELLAQMQQTVNLLERFVVAATANRRVAPRRRRPTPKNADEEGPAAAPSTAAEKAARAVSDYFRQRPSTDREAPAVGGSGRRPGKTVRRRGGREQRPLQLGRLERLPAGTGDQRAQKPEIEKSSKVDASHKKTGVKIDGIGGQLELKRQRQRQEVDTAEDVEDADDDDIEVMSDRIHAIIADPTSSFSYENISPEDMVSLQEMMSQSSDYGTMKLVEKDEDEVEGAVTKSDGSTAATPTVKGDDSGVRNDSGDVMAKPAQQAAEAETAQAADGDSPKTF